MQKTSVDSPNFHLGSLLLTNNKNPKVIMPSQTDSVPGPEYLNAFQGWLNTGSLFSGFGNLFGREKSSSLKKLKLGRSLWGFFPPCGNQAAACFVVWPCPQNALIWLWLWVHLGVSLLPYGWENVRLAGLQRDNSIAAVEQSKGLRCQPQREDRSIFNCPTAPCKFFSSGRCPRQAWVQ